MGNSYVIIILELYIHYNYWHYYFNQQSSLSTYCAWSYSLHATVPAATSYALMLLCVCTVIYSLAWPDPIICRDAIAFSISVYTANNNAPMQTRVWPCESTVACLCPLHYHMGTSTLLLLHCYQNFQYLYSTIHLMSTNSASADNATSEYQVQIIGYVSYLKLR